MWTIEPAGPADRQEIAALGEELFVGVGEVGRLLPRLFATPGVTTFLARERGQALGLIMFGFVPWTRPEADDAWLADLLALGVRSAERRRGLGRALYARMLEVVEQMATWRELRELQAVCPADQPAALAFFEQAGFSVQDRRHGRYADGRLAWRLVRPLASRGA